MSGFSVLTIIIFKCSQWVSILKSLVLSWLTRVDRAFSTDKPSGLRQSWYVDHRLLLWLKCHSLVACRVPHGYGNTHGVSKMGNAGTVMVLIFGAP